MPRFREPSPVIYQTVSESGKMILSPVVRNVTDNTEDTESTGGMDSTEVIEVTEITGIESAQSVDRDLQRPSNWWTVRQANDVEGMSFFENGGVREVERLPDTHWVNFTSGRVHRRESGPTVLFSPRVQTVTLASLIFELGEGTIVSRSALSERPRPSNTTLPLAKEFADIEHFVFPLLSRRQVSKSKIVITDFSNSRNPTSFIRLSTSWMQGILSLLLREKVPYPMPASCLRRSLLPSAREINRPKAHGDEDESTSIEDWNLLGEASICTE